MISGDLAHQGEIEAYAALKDRLAKFQIPTFLMIGGHDSRDRFFEVFANHPRDENGYAQFTHQTAEAFCIFIDSVGPESSGSGYCDLRLSWLRDQLEIAPDLPLLIFSHHPPFDVNIALPDGTRLADGGKIAELIADRPVHHFFFGHVHRPMFCTWQGILCSGVPGLVYQVPLTPSSVSSSYSIEPPMYAVININAEGTMVHFDAFMHRSSAESPAYRTQAG